MDYSIAGFPVLHCFQGFAQTHVHWVSDAIQSSHQYITSYSLRIPDYLLTWGLDSTVSLSYFLKFIYFNWRIIALKCFPFLKRQTPQSGTEKCCTSNAAIKWERFLIVFLISPGGSSGWEIKDTSLNQWNIQMRENTWCSHMTPWCSSLSIIPVQSSTLPGQLFQRIILNPWKISKWKWVLYF